MLISVSVDEKVALTQQLFGDRLRAEIVAHLAGEQLCTCHLVDITGARQPTVSHHLKILRDAGLVEAVPHGRFTYYRLRPERLHTLRDAIGELAVAVDAAPPRRLCP